MSILVNKDSRVVVQGLTGAAGSFHTEQCIAYGTKVVGGVTPGKGGTRHLGVPVFDTVSAAVQQTGADVSLIFVPAPFSADAIMESVDSGIDMVVCITEGIPVIDMAKAKCFITAANGRNRTVRLVGPNCPGVITPGECKLGIMPGYIHKPGKIGVVSRSGTLTYEVVNQLTREGLGQSTVVGIGGDPIVGSDFVDILGLFEADPGTEAVVMTGEIGGSAEEAAAKFIKARMKKPVFSFVAGKTAPPGRRMGHAGAIIEGKAGTHASKVEALRGAGVTVVENLSEIGVSVARALKAATAA